MNHVIIFLLLLINYGKYVTGNENEGKSPNDNSESDDNDLDEKWKLYPLETNPFIDLLHPNFKGDFIRCIDEYYIYETKEYNEYKIQRYNSLKNNKKFQKKQFNCAINILVHGRPNSRNTNDYKIWSAPANIMKHEAMLKKKYSKYILYTPFVSLTNFLGTEGLYTHVNYAYIIANRLSLTFKNMLEDDTCYNYDVFIHSHCFGANIVRLILTSHKDIWKILDTSFINSTYEREVLSILDDNFKLSLKDINILTDRSHIQIRKDPYFKTCKNYLYKSFQRKITNKKETMHFDDIFDDYNVKYDVFKEDFNRMYNSTNYNDGDNTTSDDILKSPIEKNDEENEQPSYRKGKENQVNRFVKRLHFYVLNKKFNLLGITATGPPLSGFVSNMEDIKVGHQKFTRYKFLFRTLPSSLRSKMFKTRDAQELIHVVNPQLLCLLAVNEKINYDYTNDEGSLITFFKSVSYYSDLDNDELMSMHSSLGLHSSFHMRSLSYYLLNFRNEYFHRTYSIPVYLSDINVSNNYPFFEYLKKCDVCSNIKHKYIEQFVSYINEIVNYEQKPQPFIPNRYVYKNPFLKHYVVPYVQENIYSSHSILGTGRTYLLLYSFDIYRHIAITGFSNNNVVTNNIEIISDSDPLVFYNWLTYSGNQNYLNCENFIQDVFVYSDNLNMNMMKNLFNVFLTTHYVKFFIFTKTNSADIYRSLYRTLRSFSLPLSNVILRKQRKKDVIFPLLSTTELDYQEGLVYEYLGVFTNFLRNYSQNNSYFNITDDNFLISQRAFKKLQKRYIKGLKLKLKEMDVFIKENKTFKDIKNKIQRMYNIENTRCSNEGDLENNENVVDFSTFESYLIEDSSDDDSDDSSSSTSNNNTATSYVKHHGIYLHIKRSMFLKEAFESIRAYNESYNYVYFIEFIIRNAMHEHIEDHLNNLSEVNSCLFGINEEIELSYISKYCNYDQQAYFHIKKNYNSKRIFSVRGLIDCSHEKYSHLKICENSILLKKFFHKSLDTIVSGLHDKEKKRMTEMRGAIEKGMEVSDILSLSNDSLAAVFHNKNEDIANFTINACFKVLDTSDIDNFFFKDDDKEGNTEDLKGREKFKDAHNHDMIFCTQVTLPVFLNKLVIKSVNDVYLRAIRNIMKNGFFRDVYSLRGNDEPYDSFVYFFDNFSYVYNIKKRYESINKIRTFNTPQTIKWNYFYYLLKYDSKINYNDDVFLKEFFYGKTFNTVKPRIDNIMHKFMTHFTVFFYLFKVK
ncbi:conserved Plasmodium protein, unknown function [Plasmodium malariae]|uniref:Uncharacterized protein n=1 Tax=Plasmodium malariae TaxID=5858 RepID=A0A1C3L2J4_PLAMA|nr:conserved Plasmodium protein, unknown function [Plasmodium malariae]